MATMMTGGILPPEQKVMQTGGPLPPEQVKTMTTGGNLPPNPAGGGDGLPTTSPVGIMDWQSKLAQGNTSAQTRGVGSNELVSNQLTGLISSNSPYITQAEDRARNEASSRGMMMSTMAAGAGRRAAIDAALPIAQQDASTYGRTASENMAATNADRLADQSMFGTLVGQEVGIRANLDESERARGFTSRENDLSRQFQTNERLGSQDFQKNMQQMQNAWQGAQNNTQRQHELLTLERQEAHDAAMRELDRNFQGSQLDKQLLQQRFLEFENAMSGQSQMLANTIASIYNNPNLNATQQASAVNNARAVFQSVFTSYAASMSGGVPPIFYNPYPMDTTAPPTTPPPVTVPPPVTPPTNTGGTGGYGGGSIFGQLVDRAFYGGGR